MNGQGAHLAGFLVLSAALHAALMLLGSRPEIRSIGPAGRVMQVSMAYRAAAAVPPSPAVDRLEGSTSRAPHHTHPKRPASTGIPSQAARHRPANPPHDTARATPVTTQATETPDPATPVPPSSVHSSSGEQSAEEHLRSSILRLVSSRFHYPVLARRKGMEGIVRLQVRIESDGRISRLQVQQTSGYQVLDLAALQSLQLASVPDAAQWMNGQAIDIIIPVEYRLVGG
jgi:protein TonB